MSASSNQYNRKSPARQEQIEFNQDGWPISPETGKAYSRDEIVVNPAIPYPIDVDSSSPYWARRSPEALAHQKAEIAKKAKIRNRRNARRKTRTPQQYTGFGTSSASQQRDTSYLSMAELVDRANGNKAQDNPDNEILLTSGGNTRTLVVCR